MPMLHEIAGRWLCQALRAGLATRHETVPQQLCVRWAQASLGSAAADELASMLDR